MAMMALVSLRSPSTYRLAQRRPRLLIRGGLLPSRMQLPIGALRVARCQVMLAEHLTPGPHRWPVPDNLLTPVGGKLVLDPLGQAVVFDRHPHHATSLKDPSDLPHG